MEAIIPYLLFNGDAADAMAFYAKALKGKVLFKQTFGESPMPSAEEMKDKIMHATFQAGQLTLMVSDCPPDRAAINGNSVSLSLNFLDIVTINETFAALSEGANVTMELQDTFWGARFGMLIDKFGINWMFNHDYKKEDKS
ncbi:MAG: glyoxalase/bleomycin resistance/extradiol dioxygenase family protein [Ferruginibacter sp.]